eukprot:4454892-Pleurochrysis_carterae.AAC.2
MCTTGHRPVRLREMQFRHVRCAFLKMHPWATICQSQGSFRKTKQGGGASMRRSLFGSETKTVKHHITYHATQRSVACEDSALKGTSSKSGVAISKEKPKNRAGIKTLKRCYGAGGLNRDGGGREKEEEHDGAGGACARGSEATAYERRPHRLLNTSSSLLSTYECSTSCRPSCLPIATFSATWLIAASPLEAICTDISISPTGALLSSLMLSPREARLLSRPGIAGCEFICAPAKVRPDETHGAILAKLRLPLPPLPYTKPYYLLLWRVNPLSSVLGLVPLGHKEWIFRVGR